MKSDIVEKLKAVEESLQKGEPLSKDDLIFLFGVSLIRDKKDE